MRYLTMRTLAVAALAGLGAAACGSKGSTGPSFSGTIDDGSAHLAGEAADQFTGDMVGTFNFGRGPTITLSPKYSPKAVALLNFAWQATGAKAPHYRIRGQMAPPVMPSSATGCGGGDYITVGGDSSDTDGDGIPNNETITFNCDTTYGGGEVVSIHGTVHIQDVPGLYGYQFSVDLSESQTLPDTSLVITISGSDNATFTAASITDDFNLTENIDDKEGAVTTGVGFNENWDATFTAAGGPIAYGSPLPDGSIAFTGGYYTTNPADATKNFKFTILTTIPLTFHAACEADGDEPPFDGGVIKGEFNGSATVGFTVTYSACDASPDIVGTGNEPT